MYNKSTKVYDVDLMDIDVSDIQFNVRDVKLGLGKGYIKEVYSDNSFVVKFENEKNLIMYSDNGHRYDRDGRLNSKKLLIIESKEIKLRYKIAKILGTKKIETYLNKKGVINKASFIKVFKDQGYSPTNIEKYLNDIMNKNIELINSDTTLSLGYFYDYLKTKEKQKIKDYFLFLKEYYK